MLEDFILIDPEKSEPFLLSTLSGKGALGESENLLLFAQILNLNARSFSHNGLVQLSSNTHTT